MMKILVVRFSSIGDVVLCSPVLRCLKKQLPGATIHFATKKNFAPVVAANPYIDKLQLLGDDFAAFAAGLKEERYDVMIDLHHNLRTYRLSALLGIRSHRFDKLNWQKWLLTNLKINVLPPVHIVDRLMQTVAPLGVKYDGQGLDFFIAPQNAQPALPPGFAPNNYTALVLGATYATKRLPTARMIALCKLLQGPVLLLGGPEDKTTAEELMGACAGQQMAHTCGLYNLQQSAQAVQWSQKVIAHDTGLMHIAAALRKPIISIWGNTVPAFGMTPYYPANSNIENQAFEVPNLKCRPCSKIGYQACPKGHFACMQHQDLPAIARAAMEIK